jgi:hypothetical protein
VLSVLTCVGRFAVLVTGTMVYGRGDEEGSKQELAEAMADALDTTPAAAAAETTPLLLPAAAVATPAAVVVPGRLGVLAPSDPIVVRSSFKATMNLMSGSYSRCACSQWLRARAC